MACTASGNIGVARYYGKVLSLPLCVKEAKTMPRNRRLASRASWHRRSQGSHSSPPMRGLLTFEETVQRSGQKLGGRPAGLQDPGLLGPEALQEAPKWRHGRAIFEGKGGCSAPFGRSPWAFLFQFLADPTTPWSLFFTGRRHLASGSSTRVFSSETAKQVGIASRAHVCRE